VAEFHFKLASVLRFRERVKQEKQWEMALLNERMRELEKEICDLQEEVRQAEARVAMKEGAIYLAIELQLQGNHAGDLLRRINQKRAAIATLNTEIAQQREELVEAMRGVKILEQLRQRLKEKFRLAVDLADQKISDEMGLQKFTEPRKR
jgi:flagellar export protein FliJ